MRTNPPTMKRMTPLVRFTTLKPFNLPQLELILGFQRDNLEKVAGKYALYGNPGNMILDCPVPDFYYDEVMEDRTFRQTSTYNRLVETFGQESVDLLVLKDLKVVVQRTRDILDLAMDKVFKCDTMGVVIESENFFPMNYDSVPHAIYATLRTFYGCKSREDVWIKTGSKVHRTEAYVITKQKEDDHS
ncbi:MAG: hypothetical protein NC131_10935 [Roseburia sp.]|nr:hypothetical protein [Roseburia sp.]